MLPFSRPSCYFKTRLPSCALGTSFYTVSEGRDLMTYVSDNYTSYSAPSPLRDHLIRIHPKDYKLEQSSATSTSTSLDNFLKASVLSHSRHITELITDMVARDLLPAAIVKGEGFRALLNYIEPGYKIPSDTHIASVIQQKHEVGKRAMMQRLKNENAFIAFTSDIWTSCANDAYISLTAHFTDSDWELVSCVLGSSPFPGHHNGSHIYEKLKDITHAFVFDQHS